jgi:hypothetical protein
VSNFILKSTFFTFNPIKSIDQGTSTEKWRRKTRGAKVFFRTMPASYRNRENKSSYFGGFVFKKRGCFYERFHHWIPDRSKNRMEIP